MRQLWIFLLGLASPCWAQPVIEPPSTDPGGVPLSYFCASFYPEEAYRANISGDIAVRFTVSTDGVAKEISISKSSGNVGLDRAATACVAADRYKPGKRNGVPAEMTWDRTITLSQMTVTAKGHTCFGYIPADIESDSSVDTTELAFGITSSGSVDRVSVKRSSGNARLDDAAVTCAKTWRYKRGVEDRDTGKSIDMAIPWRAGVLWNAKTLPPEYTQVESCISSREISAEKLVGIDGVTHVEFLFLGGRQFGLKTTQSSGDLALDQEALRCVLKMQDKEYAYGVPPTILRARLQFDWRQAPRHGS